MFVVDDNHYFEFKGDVEEMTIALWFFVDSGETDGGSLVSKPWNGGGEYNYKIQYIASGNRILLYLKGNVDYSLSTPVGSVEKS